MIDRILQSLDESAQSGGGRHSVRPISLELAIEMKKQENGKREEFENAILELGCKSSPFSAPPNGLSHYQVTLLLSMAAEMKLVTFNDVVAGNFHRLNHFPKSNAVDVEEIKNHCLKFLRVTSYDNESFWVDLLQSEHTDLSQKSIAAVMLCSSHANLVIDQFDVLFSDANAQRSALAWNIYSKVDAESYFVECISDTMSFSNPERFLESLNFADPSGTARSRFEEWIREYNSEIYTPQHVVPRDGKWGVRKSGSDKVTKTFDTQREAID